jgi:hypothetical protein
MEYGNKNFDPLVSTFTKVSSAPISMKFGTGVSTIKIIYDFNCDA